MKMKGNQRRVDCVFWDKNEDDENQDDTKNDEKDENIVH
uniref:Uncharacterized protein n=1 Tax=Tetranychus urticae TaxID=32264 RepID=T1JPY6_TETUR